MNPVNMMVLAGLAGAILTLLYHRERLFPLIAIVAAGVETLMVFDIINISVKAISLWLVLGAALAVTGGVIWARSGTKLATTGATALFLVGVVQVISAL